ncbi:hypothetical protein [Verrucosispora sp. TAA-831]|uniref:hypothetical protein n=1 Tax=Verrucosispora sp. TAA-831 TaxID=3422227 RepID=UPI003D6E5268
MAHRTLSRLLLTAFGVSLLTAAGQLGVAFGFGILRLTGTFTGATVNQWPAQLVWAGWFAANAAVVGAVLTERLAERHGGLTGTHRQLAVACSAALGAVVVAPLCMRPARAVELVSVDPVWAVAICAVLGAVVGAGAALAALLRPTFAWNMAGIAGTVWLLALLSVAPSLASTGPLTPVRLGVLEPSWLTADAAQRLSLLILPLVSLLAGAATGALARWRGQPPLISGPSGVAGPILVAFAYLAAGPGDASDRYQLAPYYGALIAVAVGALGSAAAALIPLAALDRDTAGTAGTAGTAIEPTAILQPLPTSPALPTSADRPTGTEADAGAVAVADPPGGPHTGPDRPVTGDASPPHWHWPGEPAAPVPAASGNAPIGPASDAGPRTGLPTAAGPTIDGDVAPAAGASLHTGSEDLPTGTAGLTRPDESAADAGATATGPGAPDTGPDRLPATDRFPAAELGSAIGVDRDGATPARPVPAESSDAEPAAEPSGARSAADRPAHADPTERPLFVGTDTVDPAIVDPAPLGTPALAVQATGDPDHPDQPPTLHARPMDPPGPYDHRPPFDTPSAGTGAIVGPPARSGAITEPWTAGPDPVGDGGDLTPTAGPAKRPPRLVHTPRPLAEPPNRIAPVFRAADQDRSPHPFDASGPTAQTPMPRAGVPDQAGGPDFVDTAPVPPGGGPGSTDDDEPTGGGRSDSAVTPAPRPVEGPETAPWPRHRLPLPDLNTTATWNAFTPARHPDPADATDEAGSPTGPGTDGPSGLDGGTEPGHAHAGADPNHATAGVDSDPGHTEAGAGTDPATAARDVSAAFASAAPAVSTDPAAAARDVTAAFSKPPAPRAEPAPPKHERERGRRGLFRRNRPRPVETDPAEQEEPLAAQDEEYVDWVAGLGRPSIEDEPLPKEARRRLRPTGRHHRE